MADIKSSNRDVSVPLALKFFIGSVCLLAVASGFAAFVTYSQKDSIAARAVDTALSSSTAIQKEIEQSRLDQLQLKLQLIAADPSTAKYVAQAAGTTSNLPGLSESNDLDTKSISDLLKERQSQYTFDLGIILDSKGVVLGRSDQTEAFQESLANDPLVKPAVTTAEPFSGYWRQGDKLYQAAIVPLAQDQDLVGFLLLAQRVTDELGGQMAKISGAQIAFWLPQDKQLKLVATSLSDADAKALQEAVSTQAPELTTAVVSGQSLPRVTLQFAGEHWAAQLAPTAAPGEGSLGAVLALASTDKILASYTDILHWVGIGALISIFIALVLSYFLAKGIVRPVRTMAEAAEQAAAGNYRTQIGLKGNDELARLSRAFDSLLSDLREKSDIEGYVSNLSRFLPDLARESAAPAASKAPAVAAPDPARRETLSLLGLEFRELANIDAASSADDAAQRLDNAAALVDGASEAASVRQGTGARFIVGFAGNKRSLAALRALAQIRQRATQAGLAQPAAVLVSGAVVHVGTRNSGPAVLGIASLHLDRLMSEAAPGQTLLTRQGGDEIKAAMGQSRLTVAAGAATGKKFYALSESALTDLPADSVQSAATTDGDALTVIPISKLSGRSDAVRTTRAVSLEPGSTFGGRYRILSELGTGGMGVVYKAHDLELDDVVALKMLKPSALMDYEQLDRLKSEIKLARMITHPNVLRTFDFGEVDGHPYISMEYVRGLTLRYLLSETKRLPYSAGLRIARQLCSGLAAAHEVGVLHRDIKPENLILQQNGNAKLMDFGIARPIRQSIKGHTEPGTFLGTPNYSPPEQLAGEELDQRADIYSSGVLMCEMFCGKLPFSGSNTLEIYIAQTQQAPIKPSEFWPEIPEGLEAIILRCLQRQPVDRFATANDLSAALAQLRA